MATTRKKNVRTTNPAAVAGVITLLTGYSETALRANLTRLKEALDAAATSQKDPAAVTLGRRGGQVTSAAKAAAARANGRRGGRPTLPR